jgi:hypothetical protein
MADQPDSLESARFRAFILLMPAVPAFLGMLAEIHLNQRWLAFASVGTASLWVDTIMPAAMGTLLALPIVAAQVAVVGLTYRIGVFPLTWRVAERDVRWRLVGFLAAAAGTLATVWAAPLLVDGRASGAGPNAFLVATFLFTFFLVAPAIIRGERARVGGMALP